MSIVAVLPSRVSDHNGPNSATYDLPDFVCRPRDFAMNRRRKARRNCWEEHVGFVACIDHALDDPPFNFVLPLVQIRIVCQTHEYASFCSHCETSHVWANQVKPESNHLSSQLPVIQANYLTFSKI
jgi:hypothetical protein